MQDAGQAAQSVIDGGSLTQPSAQASHAGSVTATLDVADSVHEVGEGKQLDGDSRHGKQVELSRFDVGAR